MRRVIVILTVVAVLCLGAPTGAQAGPGDDASRGNGDADGSRTFGATAVGTKPGTVVTPKGSNVLAGCLILTNITDSEVLALTRGHGETEPLFGESDDLFTFVDCPSAPFGGSHWLVWVATDPVPRVVVDAVALAAYNQSVVPLPTPMSSPEGTRAIPFLTQLETWFWTEEDLWQSGSVTASIPELGISVTATVSPVQSVWDPGDGSASIACLRGIEWIDSSSERSSCGHTYRAATQHDGEVDPVTIKSTITWEVSYVCAPVGNCTGPPNVPGQITTVVSRDVLVTEIRGILTG